MIKLGYNPHGTRVIQKLIERLVDNNLLTTFNKIFFQHVINLAKDVNGNHIVIKFVFTIQYKENNYIYEILNNSIYEIASDKHGCCVLQKCIEAACEIQRVSFY